MKYLHTAYKSSVSFFLILLNEKEVAKLFFVF